MASSGRILALLLVSNSFLSFINSLKLNLDISRYHIPLLLVSFINMNLHSLKDFYYSNPSKENFETIKGEIYDDLTFTLIALVLMGFIYIKTNLEHNWFRVLTIKKGLFSSLIVNYGIMYFILVN